MRGKLRSRVVAAAALFCLAPTKKSAKKVPQHHKNPNVNKADKD